METGERDCGIGIVFAGGDGPDPRTLRTVLDGLERCTAVAADSGLLLAIAAGVEPDFIVGDMDSLGDETLLSPYPAERVIRHPVDKDLTDTEIALELLGGKGFERIWIVGGGGGKLSHLLAIRSLFERKRFPLRWITSREDVRCVASGETLETAILPGDGVSVLPLGEGPWQAESSGLKWPLNPVNWDRGVAAISNVVVEGWLRIRALRGRFMVILEGICPQQWQQ